jgi:chromosome segregation ATPase
MNTGNGKMLLEERSAPKAQPEPPAQEPKPKVKWFETTEGRAERRAQLAQARAKFEEWLTPGGFADRLSAFEADEAGVLARLEEARAETAAYPQLRRSFTNEREDHERWRALAKDEREATQRDISRGREQYEKLMAKVAKAEGRK